MSGAFIPAGIRQDVNRVPSAMPPQVEGEHLFTIESQHRVTGPAHEDGYHLDGENLLMISGPRCYWCLRGIDDSDSCPGIPS